MSSSRPSKLSFSADPWWWAALVTLVVNDHVLKAAWPGVVTGKLSDFAGLYVAPIVLVALWRGRAPLLAYGLTGAVFTLTNVSQGAADGLAGLLGWRLWADPTDLIALPMLALSWRRHVRVDLARARVWFPRAAVALGAVASIATAPPPEPPEGWGWDSVPPESGELRILLDRIDGEALIESELVRLRELRDGVTIDCDAVRDNPRRYLDPSVFRRAVTYELVGGERVRSMLGSRECAAVWLDHDVAGPALVVWDRRTTPMVRLRRNGSVYGWVITGATTPVLEAPRPRVPEAMCAPLPARPLIVPSIGARVEGEFVMREWELDALEGIDGCTELALTPIDMFADGIGGVRREPAGPRTTHYACGYSYALFEPFIGAPIQIWSSDLAREHLHFVRYSPSGRVQAELRIDEQLPAGFDAAPNRACAQVNGCGELIEPWRVRATDPSWEPVGTSTWAREDEHQRERFEAAGHVRAFVADAGCVDGANEVGRRAWHAHLVVYSAADAPIDDDVTEPGDGEPGDDDDEPGDGEPGDDDDEPSDDEPGDGEPGDDEDETGGDGDA